MESYTDIKDNQHRLIQRVEAPEDNREEAKKVILEELYNIFAKK